MKLSENMGIVDTLKAAQGQKLTVVVHLTGGQTLEGRVAGVSSGALVLSELVNKEFYDALVSTGEIAAIELRVRES
jgi:small nuclear ribonucleoprotein (snRNP)-like protein